MFLHGRPLAEYLLASEKAKPEAAPSKQSAPTEDFLAPDEVEAKDEGVTEPPKKRLCGKDGGGKKQTRLCLVCFAGRPCGEDGWG